MSPEERESVASMFERAIDLATGIDEEAAFELIFEIVQRRDKAFELAIWRLRTGDALERSLAMNILGLLCLGRTSDEPDYVMRILERTKSEKDENVKRSAILALRHAADPRGIPWLMTMSTSGDAAIRRTIMQALGASIANAKGDKTGLDVLIAGMSDFNDDVRERATHEVALVIRHDTARVREALVAKLDDSNAMVVRTAIAGLARRRDQRALPLVEANLQSGDVWRLDVEAAASLRSPRLQPLLKALEAWWDLDPELLSFATDACDLKVEARKFAQYEIFRKALQHKLRMVYPDIHIALACDVSVEGGPVIAVSDDHTVDVSWPSIDWHLQYEPDPALAGEQYGDDILSGGL